VSLSIFNFLVCLASLLFLLHLQDGLLAQLNQPIPSVTPKVGNSLRKKRKRYKHNKKHHIAAINKIFPWPTKSSKGTYIPLIL
jgi:hypothetical protein